MRVLFGVLIGLIAGFLGTGVWVRRAPADIQSPLIESIARPLDAYTIPQLSGVEFTPSRITLEEAEATTSAYTVWRFSLHMDDVRTGISDDRYRVTGIAHIPIVLDSGDQSIKTDQKHTKKFPVIVQLRGYVDRSIFESGIGTQRSAEVFASNGFISLAPDFLGYGESSMPSNDIFEERFQTYTVALTLLASVGTLPQADAARVGIWGHSNGGQIALTAAEATGEPYPISLWAPVTKPFPYSILYYTDEADDRGKFLRKKLAGFEDVYDADLYALTGYLDRIRGPLQIHQGGQDDAVPQRWSDEFAELLKEADVDVTYYTYPAADHNLTPGWDTVVSRDIEFFRKNLK